MRATDQMYGSYDDECSFGDERFSISTCLKYWNSYLSGSADSMPPKATAQLSTAKTDMLSEKNVFSLDSLISCLRTECIQLIITAN